MRLRVAPLTLLVAVVPLATDARRAHQSYVPDETAPSAQTCPQNTVVWVNTDSGVYHLPGMRRFGQTRDGRYMCRKDADRAGYRDTRNGQ